MRRSGRGRGSLLTLASAAVLTVYAAGYSKTRSAAQRFAAGDRARERPVVVALPAARPADPRGADTVASGVPVAIPAASRATVGQGAAKRASHDGMAGDARAGGSKSTPRPTDPAAGLAADGNQPSPAAPAGDSSGGAAQAGVPREGTTATGASAAGAQTPANGHADTAAAVIVAPDSSSSTSAAADSAAQTDGSAPALKDGTYYGWGSSRHGDIQASVVIQGGRIVSASIAQCLTRYSCSWIAKLPPQVVERQSPEVDYVSGATQSTNAFYYAVVDALAKAK